MGLFNFLLKKKTDVKSTAIEDINVSSIGNNVSNIDNNAKLLGIEYDLTGVIQYEYLERGESVMSISRVFVPNAPLYIHGYGKSLCCSDLGLNHPFASAGDKRYLKEDDDKIYGYYEYVNEDKLKLVSDNKVYNAESNEHGWKVYHNATQIASIQKFEENLTVNVGHDTCKLSFDVSISVNVNEDVYPLILAIPFLGFRC